MANYFRFNFLIVALIAIMNCANRNDYNLPLGIFAFLIWNYPYERSQKHRIIWMFIFSIICDLLWFLIISVGEWGEVGGQNSLKTLTQVLSIINFVYKIGIVVFAIVKQEECKNLLSW